MGECKLTTKEIFVQLTILQKELTENSNTSLHRLGDAISSAFEGEEGDSHYDQIADICDVFKTRELTLLKKKPNEILRSYEINDGRNLMLKKDLKKFEK